MGLESHLWPPRAQASAQGSRHALRLGIPSTLGRDRAQAHVYRALAPPQGSGLPRYDMGSRAPRDRPGPLRSLLGLRGVLRAYGHYLPQGARGGQSGPLPPWVDTDLTSVQPVLG